MKKKIPIFCFLCACLIFVTFFTFYLIGWKFNIVLSGSMEPAIAKGSVAITKPYDGEALINQVILFESPIQKASVLHRITEENLSNNGDLTFVTRGDANNAEDRFTVNEKDIRGLYAFQVPMLGYVANFVKENILWVGFMIILIIALSIKKKSY